MNQKGRTVKSVGNYNNKLVMRLLLDRPYSCKEISERINLTHPAAGLIVERLLEGNLIEIFSEREEKRKKGGQHIRYTVNKNRAYFICVYLIEGAEKFTVYNLQGETLYGENLETRFIDREYVENLSEKLDLALEKLNIEKGSVANLSFAIAGRVDAFTGDVIMSWKMGKDVNLKTFFARKFENTSIDIINDCTYAFYGSMLTGECDYEKGSHMFLYVDFAFSCCLVYEGKPVTGATGFGGEVGQSFVDRSKNRFGDVTSIQRLLTVGRECLKNPEATLEEVMEASYTHHAIKRAFTETGERIGGLLKNLIVVAGCTHIVFCGSVIKYPKYFFDVVERALYDEEYSDNLQYKLEFSKVTPAMGQLYMSRLHAVDWLVAGK